MPEPAGATGTTGSESGSGAGDHEVFRTELTKLQNHSNQLDEILRHPDDRTDDGSNDYTHFNHPAAFTFPSLSPDGSIEDIEDPRVHRHHYTPPAALSSLGARLNMVNRNSSMADSLSSLDDSSYDMVDDASEVSIESHHSTASLLSISDDDEPVPGIESQDKSDGITDADEPSQGAKNEIVQDQASIDEEIASDSILTDDLDTPRQSTIDSIRQSFPPIRRAVVKNNCASSAEQVDSDKPVTVLLIADRDLSEVERSAICLKVTGVFSHLSTNFPNTLLDVLSSEGSSCGYIKKLPATPSGINPSLSINVHIANVQMAFQHCVGATIKETDARHSYNRDRDVMEAFNLQVLDVDDEYSSIYAVGPDIKPQLEKPDFAILCVPDTDAKHTWMSTAFAAMNVLDVPVLISYNGLSDEHEVIDFLGAYTEHNKKGQIKFLSGELQDVPQKALRFMIEALNVPALDQYSSNVHRLQKAHGDGRVYKAATKAPKESEAAKESKDSKSSALSSKMLLFKVLPTLLMTLSALYLGAAAFFQAPLHEVAGRREALVSALSTVLNSTNASATINLDHLLPTPSAIATGTFGQTIYSTPTEVHFDHILPNHMIIALPKSPGSLRSPSFSSVRVHKADRDLAFNCTKLIDGVYDIIFDEYYAYGLITVDMLVQHPTLNVTAEHDFGPITYKRAGTELSKSVNKELSIITNAARSFRELLGMEIRAGVAATQNVTGQITEHVTQDLKLRADQATSAILSIDEAAIAITKELATVQNSIIKFTKQSIRSPLKASMDGARGLRDKVMGRKTAEKSTGITSKELSLFTTKDGELAIPAYDKCQGGFHKLHCLRAPDSAECKSCSGEEFAASERMVGRNQQRLGKGPVSNDAISSENMKTFDWRRSEKAFRDAMAEQQAYLDKIQADKYKMGKPKQKVHTVMIGGRG